MRVDDGGVTRLAGALAEVCVPEVKLEQVRAQLDLQVRIVVSRLAPFHVSSDVETRLAERREAADRLVDGARRVLRPEPVGRAHGSAGGRSVPHRRRNLPHPRRGVHRHRRGDGPYRTIRCGRRRNGATSARPTAPRPATPRESGAGDERAAGPGDRPGVGRIRAADTEDDPRVVPGGTRPDGLDGGAARIHGAPGAPRPLLPDGDGGNRSRRRADRGLAPSRPRRTDPRSARSVELLAAGGTAGGTGRHRRRGDDQRVRRPSRHGRAPRVRASGRRVRRRERGPPGLRRATGELRGPLAPEGAPGPPSWSATWTGPSPCTVLSKTMPAASTARTWTWSRTSDSARSSPGSRPADRCRGRGA